MIIAGPTKVVDQGPRTTGHRGPLVDVQTNGTSNDARHESISESVDGLSSRRCRVQLVDVQRGRDLFLRDRESVVRIQLERTANGML